MKIVPLFLKAGRDVGGLGLTEQEIGIYYGLERQLSYSVHCWADIIFPHVD